MTVQITSSLITNSIRTQYLDKYMEAAEFQRLYGAYSKPIGQDANLTMKQAMQGSAVQVNFLSDMTPGTTEISQVADINPQVLRDATATITPAAAALQGENVKRAVARASLDAGSATHNLGMAAFIEAETILETLKCPVYIDPVSKMKSFFCTLHPEVYFDILTSGVVESVGIYQDKSIVMNWEVGRVGNFRLIKSPWAKVFGAAGADNATDVATTLSSAANALSKTIVVASATSITVGDYLTIGTEETGNTFQPRNERVRVSDAYVSGTTIDIIGEGSNGGLRFPHDSAVAVRNADSVFPVLFGGPMSIAKLYAMDEHSGPFGKVVGPKVDGLVDQFQSLGWKFYGGYGRWQEGWLLRGEYSSSLEA